MRSIILKLLAAPVVVVLVAGAADAGTFAGIFGYGMELEASGTGATDPGTTLYGLNANGDLPPLGTTADYDDASWAGSPESGTPTFSLGTFDPGAGDTLMLKGFAMLTFRDAGGTPPTTITSVFGNHRVTLLGDTPVGFPPGVALSLNEAAVGGNTNNDRWSDETQSIDLLDGLAPGTYVLGTFGFASSSDAGDQFANNGGNNYGATFTVIPEPASVALLGLGGLLMVFGRRRS